MTIYPRIKAGRCRSDREWGGQVVHAIIAEHEPAYGFDKAVCGVQPGRRGIGWSGWEAPQVTCPKCLAKLAKQAEQTKEQA
jgi:hypothetical protein